MDNKLEGDRRIPWPVAHNPSMEIASASSRRNGLRLAQKWIGLILLAGMVAAISFSARGAIALSHAEARQIGEKIWQNECGRTLSGLTSWNAGENFASLGIGHFIWYPAGQRGPFEESFPKYVQYAAERGAKLPQSLLGQKAKTCPWNSHPEFLAAQSSKEMVQLRKFLADTIDLQADFMIRRLAEALPKILAAAPGAEGALIREQFERVASSSQGLYALADYVNFKGEGVLATERYQGRGWGLLQVLQGMSREPTSSRATQDFADSAGRVLRERVRNSPQERNESRWLSGWLNRVDTYR
jgi:hypothetical protein